jgi:hypothetical protein
MSHTHDTESLRSIRSGHGAWGTYGPGSWLMVLAVAGMLMGVPCLGAQGSRPTDYDVKAAYLYNFGRFVEWPAGVAAGSDSFTVCVLGQDPFGPALDATLAGETIGGKRAAAKRISSPQEAATCQILFLSSTEENRLDQVIGVLRKEAVLTVSDMPKFSQRGGMIQFVLEGKKVRFEVNLSAVQQAGLSLSSELLKVAIAVRRSPPSGD